MGSAGEGEAVVQEGGVVALRVFGFNKVDYVAIINPGLQCSFSAATFITYIGPLDVHTLSTKNYTVPATFHHFVITGLPSTGKSQILSHLIPTDIRTDCIIKDDGLSVKEALLTSDGQRWEWMQVSKTEASALGVGVGISRAYAKEGHTPNFITPDRYSDNILRYVKTAGQYSYADIESLAYINVWDVGVSRVLHDLLPLLLPPSKHQMMLSVLNLATDGDSLHSSVDMHQEKYQKRGKQDILMESYSKLDYLMMPSYLARCEVIVVGTHADLLPQGKLRARQQSVLEWVGAKAEEMGLGEMLYPKCIAVNALNQGDVMKIREVVNESIGKRHAECKIEVPLMWLCLRDNLNNSTKWWMTKEELLAAANKYGVMDEREVESFLDMYYKCGSILYNPTDPSSILHDHVIIKPPVFLSKVEELYKKLEHKAIFTHKFTEALWGKQDAEFILQIVINLGLMISIDAKNISKSDKKYLMPSLCSEYTSIFDSSSLFVVFMREMHPSVYLTGCVRFLKSLYPYEKIRYESIYCNELRLHLYDGSELADVKIAIVANYLEANVTCLRKGKDNNHVLHKVSSILKTAIVNYFRSLPGLQYDLCILCPAAAAANPHFHLLEKINICTRDSFCNHCKNFVALQNEALMWLQSDYHDQVLHF